MPDMTEETRLINLGENPHAVALDMVLRGACAPHMCCNHGLHPSEIAALFLHVLGAVAHEAGMEAATVDDSQLWERMKLNFKCGYDRAAQAEAEAEFQHAVRTVQ